VHDTFKQYSHDTGYKIVSSRYVLPRDAMLARYMLSSSVCPSVRLSVTCRHCTKTAKRRIMQITPYHYRPLTLVFWRQRSRQNSNEATPTGAPNKGGVGSNWRFSTKISLYLRKGATCSFRPTFKVFDVLTSRQTENRLL